MKGEVGRMNDIIDNNGKGELKRIIDQIKGLLSYQISCLDSIMKIQMDLLDARPIVIKKTNDFTKNQRKIAEDLQFQISTYYSSFEHNDMQGEDISAGVQIGHRIKIERKDGVVHLEIPELPPKRYYYTSQDAYMQEYEPRSLLRRRLDMLFLESCTDPSYRMDRGKVEVKYIFHIRENTIRVVDGFDIKVIQDVITEYLLTDDNYKLVSVSLEGQEIKNPNIDTDEYTEVIIRYI